MALAACFTLLPLACCHFASMGTTTGKRAPRRFSVFIGGPFAVISSIARAAYFPEREASRTCALPLKCTLEGETVVHGNLELQCMSKVCWKYTPHDGLVYRVQKGISVKAK